MRLSKTRCVCVSAVIFLGLLTSRVVLGEEGAVVKLGPFISWIKG